MKNKLIFLLLIILVVVGCKKQEQVDYSEFLFTNGSWTRDTEHDTETITFRPNGNFSYSCACGNPVNDADLCETYLYDDKTKEIKLDCFETTLETITTIKIKSSTKDILILDFNGDIRVFNK